MVFYQSTMDLITYEQLADAIFQNSNPVQIKEFHFKGYPGITTLNDALQIIDAKRKTLLRPYQHSFLSMEVQYEGNNDVIEPYTLTTQIADSINAFFDYDIFLITLLYQDEQQKLHSVLILSDIEKSSDDVSTNYFSPTDLEKIITDTLPDYQLEDIFYTALYQFNGITAEAELPYDGIIHISSQIRH